MKASVVMACRNGERYLKDTLEALLVQEWDQPWEIVFGDNGSTDKSLEIFESMAAANPGRPMIAVDASAQPGKSYALNLAIGVARADAIIICDNDDIPAAGWLRAMGEALQRYDFVSSRREIELLNTGPTGKYRGVPTTGIWQVRYAPYSDCTAGSTMGFTRRLFDAVGGFTLDFPSEDIEFCIKADLKGFKLQPVPEALLHYRLRTDFPSIYRQAYFYNKTDVKVAKHYREYGPAPRARWPSLALACAKIGVQYAIWRLRPGPVDVEEGAGIYWRMGAVAGQIDGIVSYRASPTSGLPPKKALRRGPLMQNQRPSS